MLTATTVANVAFLLSYAARDVLWLRLLTLVGLAIPYVLARHAGVEPVDAVWTELFLAINGAHVAWLVYERRPVSMSDRERALFEMRFRLLTPRAYARLMRYAHWETAMPDAPLLKEGCPSDRVLVLFSGAALAHRGGRPLGDVPAGSVLGELGYFTGDPSAATVTTMEWCELVAWDYEVLRRLADQEPELANALPSLFGQQAARWLQAS